MQTRGLTAIHSPVTNLKGHAQMTDSTVETLVADAKRGDQAAIGELTSRFRPDIVRYLEITIAKEAPDLMSGMAEDLTQEVFATFARKLQRYEEVGLFRWWLEGVAYNLFRTALRSHLRRRKSLGEDTLITGRDAEASETTSIFSTKKEVLRAVAKKLPPADRSSWELFAEGFTPAEIAERLGIKPNAVYQRINRARAQLTAWLTDIYRTNAE